MNTLKRRAQCGFSLLNFVKIKFFKISAVKTVTLREVQRVNDRDSEKGVGG